MPVVTGGGLGDGIARAAEHAVVVGVAQQAHRHARNARFVGVLQTIAVNVVPHAVANRAQCTIGRSIRGGWRGIVVAKIRRAMGLVGGQCDHSHAIGRSGTAVFVERAIGQASGQGIFRHAHGVGARAGVFQQIIAVAVGHGLSVAQTQTRRTVVLNIDRHPGNARFSGVLQAVAVFVQPYAVADIALAVQAEVIGHILVTLHGQGAFAGRIVRVVIGFQHVGSFAVGLGHGVAGLQRTLVYREGKHRFVRCGRAAGCAAAVIFVSQ